MRKAKVAAIVCGMIASCLFGGFAVVEAATITLDESSADLVVYVQPTTEDDAPVEAAIAVTVTSIEYNDTAESRTATVNYAGVSDARVNTDFETAAAVTTAARAADKAEVTATTTTTAVAAVEMPLVTTTEDRAPKESAAHPAATTAVTTAATTAATTTTTTVNVEIVPITEEVNTPPMPAEQAVQGGQAVEAEAAAEEQVFAVAPQGAQEISFDEFIFVPVEPEASADLQGFEMPDVTLLEAPAVQPYEEPTDAPAVQPDSNSVSVSQSDYILLCNAVAHEAGSNSISAEEKAKVVEVIMNRVNSSKYPDTIYGVLTQKYQFTGSSTYVDLGSFSGKVTDLVKEAVDMYLADPTRFNHGYLSFYGDGTRNHFS